MAKRIINHECGYELTTKQAKGQIIFCNGCKRNFVEPVKEMK